MHNSEEKLEYIWNQVPPDYYQVGIKKNRLQRAWHTRKLQVVLELLGKKNKNILDVGCASGWFLSEIKKSNPNARCTGVDVYKSAIDYGKKKYKSLTLLSIDAHVLPFKDELFDSVVCTEVLEHVVEPQKVLREIVRVLRPGGIAVIEMDTGNVLFRLVWYWWTHLRHGVWRDSHIHSFTATKLETMIKKAGFTIEKKKDFNYTMAVAFLARK